LGIVWIGKFDSTTDYAQAAGANTKETQLVAGAHLWFWALPPVDFWPPDRDHITSLKFDN
jgi:hypothetical protein